MTTSAGVTEITKALLKAQKVIEGAKKNAVNPFFKSNYADISSVIDACKAELNSNDIVILQPIDGDFVETTLLHTSGEWITSRTAIVCKEPGNPQSYGSAISYARRYGLQSLVLLKAEDDDGTQASNAPVKPVKADPTDSWKENIIKGACTCKTTNQYHALHCPARS